LSITACTSIDQNKSASTKIELANPVSEYLYCTGGNWTLKMRKMVKLDTAYYQTEVK
jgi:hypothetical protein